MNNRFFFARACRRFLQLERSLLRHLIALKHLSYQKKLERVRVHSSSCQKYAKQRKEIIVDQTKYDKYLITNSRKKRN